MAAVSGKNTVPEIAVRSALHRAGFRFRLHRKDLPGKPDIVLPARKTAIFVNGCFWHSHSCKRGKSAPVNNADFWQQKRDVTLKRDRKNQAMLQAMGWKVIVIWECSVQSKAYLPPLLQQLARLRR